MRIDPLDLSDDAACMAVYRVVVASRRVGRPWFDPASSAAVISEIRAVHPGERNEQWVIRAPAESLGPADAASGQAIVGVGVLWLPEDDNTDKAWLEVDVHPAARRRGVGRALAEHLVNRSRLGGRSILVADLVEALAEPALASATGPAERPYARFAESLGFELANAEANRVLDLPVASDLLDRLDARGLPRWLGRYRVETFVDSLPEELLASYCACYNRLGTDAPTGALDFEEESMTPEKFAVHLANDLAAGTRTLRSVAIAPSDEVVAYSDLRLRDGSSTALQDGTLVHRDHRGHGLGMAVKVANLRALQGDHPERVRVVTGNADTNSWMIAINEDLGFRLLEASLNYQLRL